MKDEGISSPSAKQEEAEPTLRYDLLWVWEAFCCLNSTRGTVSSGMGAVYASLSLMEVESYCNLMGISDVRSRMRLVRFIPSLDCVFLKDHAEQVSKANKKVNK